MRQEPYPDCPGEERVREVAAEIAPPEIARGTLQHISQCDHCGPLLKSYREAFSEELSPEIEAVLRQMPSATEKARRKQAKEIAGGWVKADPQPSLWETVRAWLAGLGGRAIAGATAALAIAASVVWGPAAMNAWDLHKEEKLVAAAYAERRTTEMRLPSVDHGDYRPLSKTLGSNDGLDLERPKLLEATGELAQKLKSRDKLDPRWLQIKGRIALLSDPDNSESAVKAFLEAKSAGMRSPSLDIDLATTYFERDSRADNPDLSRTIDLLDGVLKNPASTEEQKRVALFDLALTYENTKALDMAVTKWNEYLKAEPNTIGPWYGEAKKHLDTLKNKMPAPKASDFRTPAFLLKHYMESEVQHDIEQFQGFAFVSWLPKAIEDPSSAEAKALSTIAQLMREQHSDMWWTDFLSTTTQADLPAVQSLSRAFVADNNDLHYESIRETQAAARLFLKNRNVPGELISRFQEVYGLQRAVAAGD